MKTIKALGDTVIVEAPEIKEKKSEGGIILTQANDKEAKNQGVVVSVGEKVTTISVGDTVLISRMGVGEVFTFNNKFYIAMPDKEVYGIVKEVEINA